MAKFNKSNGYSVSNIFGQSERLINIHNILSEMSDKFQVSEKQIIEVIKQKQFTIQTYSREKMSYGYNGCELFTVKQEAEKLEKFIEENIEEIRGIVFVKKYSKKPVVLLNQITGEKIEFDSQLSAVKYLEYKNPNAVSLRVGQIRKINKGVFTVISK